MNSITNQLVIALIGLVIAAQGVSRETSDLSPACVKKLHTTAIVRAMDSATSERFRDILVDNPNAKFKKKVWRTPDDLKAFVSKAKWIRFHIDSTNSLRELRPNVFLVTVGVSRHRGKEEVEGIDDSVSFEFVTEREKADCRIKEVKPIDMRKN